MRTYTVRRGRRYRAVVSLFDVLAGNDLIAERLGRVGFVDVEEAGSGVARRAEGTWPNDDATAEMPMQIRSVTEVEVASM